MKKEKERMPDLGFKLMTLFFRIIDCFYSDENIIEKFGIKPGNTVIDYGCGPGRYIKKVSEVAGSTGKIYAVDIHEIAIQYVKSKIKKYKVSTLLQSSATFSRMSSNNIYLKPENLQVTGSYKIGGAINVIMNLTEDQKKRGVITTSAGNWAQAVAYASQIFNVKSVIVMKEGTSKTKIIATKGYGGKVVIYGKDTKDTMEKSTSLAKSENLTFVNCFGDENLITGHGCIGLDIIKEKPNTDVIFCPIGGSIYFRSCYCS